MRVALLADIHGNAPALKAVLEDCRNQRCDDIWFLGDILGYGPMPVSCIKMLDECQPKVWLLGNHDLAGLAFWKGQDNQVVRMLTPGLDERRIVEWHSRQLKVGLSQERVDELRSLPTWSKATQGIYVAHGAILCSDPKSRENVQGENSYIKPGSAGPELSFHYVQEMAQETDIEPWLLVVGHIHAPTLVSLALGEADWEWENELLGRPQPLSLDGDGRFYILCPGSVGQRLRELGNGLPSYAVLDTEEHQVWFRRVEYDSKETLAALIPPPREIPEIEALIR